MLREFGELSCGATQTTHAPSPSNTETPATPPIDSGETDEHWEVLLHQRYTMPLDCAIPYHRWGINE